MADRTGRIYGGPIEPDETVIQSGPPTLTDETVGAANAWLRTMSGC